MMKFNFKQVDEYSNVKIYIIKDFSSKEEQIEQYIPFYVLDNIIGYIVAEDEMQIDFVWNGLEEEYEVLKYTEE